MIFARAYRRLWLCCLLLAALVAQGLVPAGFMPAAGADGGMVAVVICTGTGPATILMDAAMMPDKDDDGHGGNAAAPTCAFAPVMAAGAPGGAPPPLLHPAPRAERPTAAPAVFIAALPAKNWLSQGPPRA